MEKSYYKTDLYKYDAPSAQGGAREREREESKLTVGRPSPRASFWATHVNR